MYTQILINQLQIKIQSWSQLIMYIKCICSEYCLQFQPLHHHVKNQRAVNGHQGQDRRLTPGCKTIHKKLIQKVTSAGAIIQKYKMIIKCSRSEAPCKILPNGARMKTRKVVDQPKLHKRSFVNDLRATGTTVAKNTNGNTLHTTLIDWNPAAPLRSPCSRRHMHRPI